MVKLTYMLFKINEITFAMFFHILRCNVVLHIFFFQGANCCSQLSISFHYTNPVQMYLLEFMLYQSEIYGRRHVTDHEPMFSQNISLIQNKKENEILLTPKYFWHYLFGNKEVYSNCSKNTATIYVTMLCIFIYQILLYTNSNC